MKLFSNYLLEYILVLVVLLLSIAGFWGIYFGADAKPTPYQNLHVVTNLIWLGLLLYQIILVRKKQHAAHRKIGLSILFLGPWLFATTALLAVYSAHKGVVSGEGDALMVQNVMGSLELGFIILMAFVVRKKRKLHGAFLLGTTVLFMGIAVFFSLIGFVPQFRIEGPETFYRFGQAGAAGSIVGLVIGIIFFAKDRRNGWPVLLAGSTFTVNQFVNTYLGDHKLIQPVTEFVGSLSQVMTFVGSFLLLLVLLLLTGVANQSRGVQPAS